MFAVRGEPVPAASLKQNDHSVTSSPNTVMPAQVKRAGGQKKIGPLLWLLCGERFTGRVFEPGASAAGFVSG